eukprot:353996-Chlamydomonas_euryale.AAC.3
MHFQTDVFQVSVERFAAAAHLVAMKDLWQEICAQSGAVHTAKVKLERCASLLGPLQHNT